MNEMQGQQNQEQQGTPVDMGLVLEEYKKKVGTLTHDNLLKDAYIKQLQKTIEQLQEQLDEATTVVEHD
jgi:predicted RNase H-like nuclease (RuvC/YqgF family)